MFDYSDLLFYLMCFFVAVKLETEPVLIRLALCRNTNFHDDICSCALTLDEHLPPVDVELLWGFSSLQEGGRGLGGGRVGDSQGLDSMKGFYCRAGQWDSSVLSDSNCAEPKYTDI